MFPSSDTSYTSDIFINVCTVVYVYCIYVYIYVFMLYIVRLYVYARFTLILQFNVYLNKIRVDSSNGIINV